MRSFATLIACTLCLSIYGSESTEQITPVVQEIIQTSSWSVGVGSFRLNKEKAFKEGVGDTPTYLNFALEGQEGNFVFAAGLSGLLFSDHNRFSVGVIDGSGHSSTTSSSASGIGVFGELGYSIIVKPRAVHFDLTMGVEKLWSERGIANCTDCPSENIDVNGGIFIHPRIRFINDNGFTMTIGYHHYVNSAIENGITLTFGTTKNLF